MDRQTDLQPTSVLFDAVRIDSGPATEQQTLSILSTARMMGLVRQLRWTCNSVKREQPTFTYEVLGPKNSSHEKRAHPRTRTRLRAGKIVDHRNGFLTECRFHDRSRSGARLELIRAIELPDSVRLFEEETGLLFAIRPVWRGENVLGISLEPPSCDGAWPSRVLGRTHYALP